MNQVVGQPIGGSKVSSPESVTPNARIIANRRVQNFRGYAFEMLKQLKKQNQATELSTLDDIYGKADEKISNIYAQLQGSIFQANPERAAKISQLEKKLKAAKEEIEQNQKNINHLVSNSFATETSEAKKTLKTKIEQAHKRQKNSYKKVESLEKELSDVVLNLSKKEIHDLKKQLKAAEKEVVKIIRDTQIELASEIGAKIYTDNGTNGESKDVEAIKSKVATLAEGGWGARLIYFLSFVSTINDAALQVFEKSQENMRIASRLPVPVKAGNSEVEKDKQTEFERGNLDRRAGVIGLNGTYRFEVAFSEKQIHKQFKSFVAQRISQTKRTTIEREIEIKKEPFTSKIIPLNKEFDEYMCMSGIITTLFGKIFGTFGISSANRQEPHLINGWETNLIQDGKTIFRALRHAILSDKYEKDPEVRAENSKKASQELIKAALLEELKTQGLSIEEAREYGITLNLNSVSLVTPDDLRPYLPGQANEKKMLLDQVLALQSFNGEQTIELDGFEIEVKVNVNAFNFGVNALADTYQAGLANQYKYNLKAMEGFRTHFNKFNKEIEKERNGIKTQLRKLESAENAKFQELRVRKNALKVKQKQANLLMQDITQLMQDKAAYLKGDNQYEIGAKILNLNSLMDQTIEDINQRRKGEDLIQRISGFKGAFNCMSGKDRTGWMDAVAKTFAIMAASNQGYYPLHEEFIKNPQRRKEFTEILEKVLLESGNLEITEFNTGAIGYKVREEARLFGISAKTFMQAQGLSATTGD